MAGLASVARPVEGAAARPPLAALDTGLRRGPLGARRAVGLVSTIAGLVLEDRLVSDAAPGVRARRAQRTARRLLAIHGVDVRSVGCAPAAPVLIVTNHVSYIDPLVIACLAPCIAIAKGETLDWPLVGAGLRALGVVFVRRGDAHNGAAALRRVWRAIACGTSVLNFPEGTTGDGRSIAPFRRGVFGLARLAHFRVVPAHISYDDDRVPWFGDRPFVPHYWNLSCGGRLTARVRFGEAMTVDLAEDPSEAAARARDVVESLRGPEGASPGSPRRRSTPERHASND